MSTIHSTLKHPLINLTEPQQSILTTDKQAVIINGLAGTGKTSTLIHKLGWFSSQNRASGSNTLFVTPSDASSRQVNKILYALDCFEFQVISIDELCLDILRQAVEQRLLVKDYLVHYFQYGATDQEQILRATLHKLKNESKDNEFLYPMEEQALLNQIKLWKKQLSFPKSRWILLPEKLKKSASIASHKDKTMELFFESYENCRIKNKLLDPESLYTTALNLLYSHESLKNHFTERLRFIFLDDFHLFDNLQYELLKPIIKGIEHLNLTLDHSNLEYLDNVNDIERAFNFEKVQLSQSFNFIKSISCIKTSSFDVEKLKASLNVFDDYQEEVEFIGEKVSQLLTQGVNPQQIAILVDSTSQIPLLESECIKRKINYTLGSEIPFFLKTPYLNVLRCLRFAITDLKIEKGIFKHNERQMSLYFDDLETMNKIFHLGLSKADFENILKKSNWFSSTITKELALICRNNEDCRTKMVAFNSFITRLKSKLSLPAVEILKWILENHAEYFSTEATQMDSQLIGQPLIKLCHSEKMNSIDFMEKVYQIVKKYKAQRQSLFQNGLSILKIDASQGQQWQQVFLSCPLESLNYFKNNKLLYQGAGRAGKELIFSSSKYSSHFSLKH